MSCTLGPGAIDAIDMGAYTKTSFVPLQKGIRIEGKSAWGEWEHNRCAECEATLLANRENPNKWDNDDITCVHQVPFAFCISCVYPDEMEYVAAGDDSAQQEKNATLSNLKKHRSSADMLGNDDENDEDDEDSDNEDDEDDEDIEANDDIDIQHIQEEGSETNKEEETENPQGDIETKETNKQVMDKETNKKKTESSNTDKAEKADKDALTEFVPPQHKTMSVEAEAVHSLETLHTEGGKLGILLSEATIHLGYKNKGSVFATSMKRRRILCVIDCRLCREKCKQNRCGRAAIDPVVFFWTLINLIYFTVVLIFWSAFMLIGFCLWIVFTLIESLLAGLRLAYDGKEMLYLRCHSLLCPCCKRWHTSFFGFVLLILFAIIWVFVGDLALQWGNNMLPGSVGILPYPYSRLHYLSLLFVIAAFLLVIEMTPHSVYDMENIRAGLQQIVSFQTKQGSENAILRGTVLMQMGKAMLVRLEDTGQKIIVHHRQILETGLTPESVKLKDKENKEKSDGDDNEILQKGNRIIKTEFETTSGKRLVTLDPKSREEWVHWSHERENAGVKNIEDIKLKEGLLLRMEDDGTFKEHYFMLRSARPGKPAELEWSTDNDVHNMDAAICLDGATTVSTEEVVPENVDATMDKDVRLFEINSRKSQKILVLGAKSESLMVQWIKAIRKAKTATHRVKRLSTSSEKARDVNNKNDDNNDKGTNKDKETERIWEQETARTATLQNVRVRDRTRWTWYDSTFGPHLLRYVLTTKYLKEFDAQRNSIHQVEEMHKVHELQGIEHEVPWDMKNSYINAFFLFILFCHLTITKNIVGVFICTRQPHSGNLTLDAHPTMTCWTSDEHKYVLGFAQFFMMIYAIGIPLFVVYKLREIFRAEREYDPKIRARYGYLYFKYTHDSYLWEIVVMARKVFIAIVRMFTKTPAYFLVQSSGALIVLAVLLVMQILWSPYNEPFLNRMETAALANHVFVLFIGIMFQSGALDATDGSESFLNAYSFAMILIVSIMTTWIFLLRGVAKELSEMGLLSMATKGGAALVMENYGKSAQKLRRTARGHWCFRWMGNCCAKKVAERGTVDDDDIDTIKKKQSFSMKMKQKVQERLRRKSKDSATKQGDGVGDGSKAVKKRKKIYQPPAPPRYPPPALHYDDWHCTACNFFNDEKEHPYSRTCAQCGKRRPRQKVQLKVSLAQKKRALGLEIDLLSNVLLSEDAQFAAVNWGIEDHSTTLRETYWLVKALKDLVHSVLEVYFNIRQVSKQQEEQAKHIATQKRSLHFTVPFYHVYRICCAKKALASIDKKVEARGWLRKIDPMSKLSYYVHVDKTHGGTGEYVEISECGWYSFFDCDHYRLFYGHLGEKGWEHTTWKRPHETDIVRNGAAGKVVTAVSWEKPKSPDAFVQIKIDRLMERLSDLDALMLRVQQIVGPNVKLPHFNTFKEFVAGLLGVPIHGLIATHINKEESASANDGRAGRHASRLLLSTPVEPVDLVTGGRRLSSIQVNDSDSDDDEVGQEEEEEEEENTRAKEETAKKKKRQVRKDKLLAVRKQRSESKAAAHKAIELLPDDKVALAKEAWAAAADLDHIFDGVDNCVEHVVSSESAQVPKKSELQQKDTAMMLYSGQLSSTYTVVIDTTTPELNKLKPKLQNYILKHKKEWITASLVVEGKIPKQMKKFFKKQHLKKALAREILQSSEKDTKKEKEKETTKSIHRKSTMQILLGDHHSDKNVVEKDEKEIEHSIERKSTMQVLFGGETPESPAVPLGGAPTLPLSITTPSIM